MAGDAHTPDEDAPEEAPLEQPEAAAEQPAPEPVAEEQAPEPVADATPEPVADDDEPEQPRAKPAIPGADLEVDLVLDSEPQRDDYAAYGDEDGDEPAAEEAEEDFSDEPVAATIDLAAGARYRATGK